MTRREAAEKIFDYIRKNNFEPINIKYDNSYFIFDMGSDGVVRFNIKGLRGWEFAMWIEVDAEKLKKNQIDGKDYPAIQFFCQHKLNMDKFKPSRSFHLVKLSLEELECDDWIFYRITDMLQMIKRHPFVAFTMDANEYEYCNESYIRCYVDAVLSKTKEAIKEWLNNTLTRAWHGSKVRFINKYKVVQKAELIDNNGEGWKTYPRYDMHIHFKKISEDEATQEAAEIKMLDLWFREDVYGNMHLTLTREGKEGPYLYKMR